MNSKRLFFPALTLLMFAGCGVGEREIIVENCAEPIEISDCKWKGQLFSCLIKNQGDTIYAGTSIWKYDADGAPLEHTPYQYATGLKPGATTRQKLPVTKYNKDTTAKIIFCKSDPQRMQ